MFFLTDSAFRSDLTFLVLEPRKNDMAGFSINFVCPPENARQGQQEGWIAELGVRPRYRRKGIASALLCRSMQAFKDAGLLYAGLSVDTENPTGALSIYRRLGFVPIKTKIAFEKPYAG